MVEMESGQSTILIRAVRDYTKFFAKANDTKPNDLSGLRGHLAIQRKIPSQAS